MWLMLRTASVEGCRHRGSAVFGGFDCEDVASRGSADGSELRTVGDGLMMAGIGGCYAQVWVGLDARSPGGAH